MPWPSVLKLLRSIDRATRNGWRDLTILHLLAYYGLRPSEVVALRLESSQGQLQGVLASAVSLASIIAPLAFSTFYFVVQMEWPGAIWPSVVVVSAIAIPLVFLSTRTGSPA
jgi:DHA1 family tetracycline resistance protein-like MFS transporter